MIKSTFDAISPRFGMNIQRLQTHHRVMTYRFSVNIPRNGYQILITLPQKHDPNQLGETNSLKQSTIIIQWCPCNLLMRGFLIKVTWFEDPWNHSLCFYTETFRQKGYRPEFFRNWFPQIIPYWKGDKCSKAVHFLVSMLKFRGVYANSGGLRGLEVKLGCTIRQREKHLVF